MECLACVSRVAHDTIRSVNLRSKTDGLVTPLVVIVVNGGNYGLVTKRVFNSRTKYL